MAIHFFKEISLPLLWGLYFLLPDVHIAASGRSLPAAEPLKSGQQHQNAALQIWRKRVKESTQKVFDLSIEFCKSFSMGRVTNRINILYSLPLMIWRAWCVWKDTPEHWWVFQDVHTKPQVLKPHEKVLVLLEAELCLPTLQW